MKLKNCKLDKKFGFIAKDVIEKYIESVSILIINFYVNNVIL